MRARALLLVGLTIAASGCAWSPDLGFGDAAATERTSAVYAAVIRRLVMEDHTFGMGPAPFERVYVIDGVVDGAGDVYAEPKGPRKPFSPAVKRSISRALADLPPVRFVSDREAVVVVGETSCAHVKNGGALISLGPISKARQGAVTVGNELFVACLAGQWLTYVLERREGTWRVVGTKGPIAVS